MSTAKPMANIIPALTARTQFGQILRRVKQNKERFVVDKRGEPQAVIMSIEEYLQRFVERPSAAATAIRREAKARGLNKLPLRQINLAIKQVRQERRRAAR